MRPDCSRARRWCARQPRRLAPRKLPGSSPDGPSRDGECRPRAPIRDPRGEPVMKGAFLIGAAVLAVLAAACTRTVIERRPASPSSATASSLANVGTSRDRIVGVVQAVRPAVVNVTTNTVSPSFFGGQPGTGVGTGFIVRADGIVVTNYHVVEGAQKITVITPSPNVQRYDARVIGGDATADLAILKIGAQGLPTVQLGNSSTLQLGQRVVAIGYALALQGGPAVTSGIVSALGRTIQSAENIGFAISINSSTPTIQHAEGNPSAPVAYLGVSTGDVTQSAALQFNLPVDRGAYVVELAPGGPAEQSGIRVGDVIVGFDGQNVTSSDQLRTLIRDHSPGDRVSIVVVSSDGGRRTVEVTLGTNPLPQG